MKRNIFAALTCLFIHGRLFSEDLVPREDLFRQPSCMAIKLSPDGRCLAYVGADKEGAMNLFVSSDLSLNTGQKVTHFQDPQIKGFYWSPDGKKIIFLKDKDGTRQFRLYCFDVNSTEMKDLTASFGSINVKLFQMSPTENKAMVGINARDPRFHDLYLLDLDNGSLSLRYLNDQFINFIFDDHLNIVLKICINPDSSLSILDKNDAMFTTVSAEDAFHTEFLRYNEKDHTLYLLDNRSCNTTQLKKILLEEKQQEVLLGYDELSDIQDVLFEEGQPVAYATYYTLKKWHPLNEKIKDDLDHLIDKIGSDFAIANQTNNSKLWVVKNSNPEKGIEFWLYHRPSKKLTLLFSFPKIQHLAKMYPLIISAGDGKKLISYLTLPPAMDRGGKPKKPLPLVIIPHGGPFKCRDFYTYSPYHQWLANRGYAVLSVNFRLSSGFGKDFVNAGNSQWGRKAHQDILDAVDWCVDAGIADKDKVAVLGASYGGYEALASLTFSPSVFACAVAVCAPSNLKTVLDHCPFYWETPSAPLSDTLRFFTRNAFITSMGGNPDKESDIPFLQSCSPLNYVDKIQKPLLLVHGANDPIVAASESDQIFESMKQKKCPVVYLSFPDEGHGINKFSNAMCYLAYSEWLLAQVLGGSYEPIHKDLLKQSSAKIQSCCMPHEAVVNPITPSCVLVCDKEVISPK